jgi:hypothetical protein
VEPERLIDVTWWPSTVSYGSWKHMCLTEGHLSAYLHEFFFLILCIEVEIWSRMNQQHYYVTHCLTFHQTHKHFLCLVAVWRHQKQVSPYQQLSMKPKSVSQSVSQSVSYFVRFKLTRKAISGGVLRFTRYLYLSFFFHLLNGDSGCTHTRPWPLAVATVAWPR